MDTDYQNYKAWYADFLPKLYPDRNAGFAILMVVFPLLERYLRQKNGLSPADTLNDSCMDGLCNIFPVLSDRQKARNFWNVYRNGILHQVTLSRQNRSGSSLPTGWLSHDKKVSIIIEPNGSFWIHPVLFSKQILKMIDEDFGTFKGISATSTRLPTIKAQPTIETTDDQGGQQVILGTSADP